MASAMKGNMGGTRTVSPRPTKMPMGGMPKKGNSNTTKTHSMMKGKSNGC